MAVHTYTGPSMNRLQQYSVAFVLTDRDGNIDTTSAAVLVSTNTNVATITIDPTDNRKAIVAGNPAGSGGPCTIGISKTGGASSVSITQTVTNVDLSGADLNPPNMSAFGPVTGPS